jgi:hypothetical protein
MKHPSTQQAAMNQTPVPSVLLVPVLSLLASNRRAEHLDHAAPVLFWED